MFMKTYIRLTVALLTLCMKHASLMCDINNIFSYKFAVSV